MLGVRPPATPTCLSMPPPGTPVKPTMQGSHVNLQALYDTILQDTHPKLVRRRNVEYAQLSTMYGGKESPRPDIISLTTSRSPSTSRVSSAFTAKSRAQTALESPYPDILSFPGTQSPVLPSRVSSALTARSRAQTVPDAALVRFTEPEFDVAAADVEEQADDRCMTSLSTLTSSVFCRRVKSAVDREVDGLVNSLSRQCCDVLGPEACHECDVVSRQQQRPKSEALYPTLHSSEENFAKSILVARMMPGMSEYVVQTKLACGEIARETFRDRLDRLRMKQTGDETDDGDDENNDNDTRVILHNVEKQPTKIVAKVSPTFFTGIRDLNSKLIDGTVPSQMSTQRQPADGDDKSFTDKICPSFISPKKVKKHTPRYQATYDPPLLPKVRQNAQPAFFAGSNGGYSLPERLPESMVLDQLDLGDPSMSRMSTNYSINPPTPTQF